SLRSRRLSPSTRSRPTAPPRQPSRRSPGAWRSSGPRTASTSTRWRPACSARTSTPACSTARSADASSSCARRCGASGRSPNWPARPSSWPQRLPASSPARSWWWTAGSSPAASTSDAATPRLADGRSRHATAAHVGSAGGTPSSVRWVICALLFFAATINYIDRNVLAVLKQPLTDEFGWTNTQFGYINFFFQLAYLVGMLASGWLIDRIVARRGLAIAIFLWSVAAMLPAE